MRKLRYTFILIVAWLFSLLLIAGSVRNIYISGNGGEGRLGFLARPLKFMAELPANILKVLKPGEFGVTDATARVRNTSSKDGFTYYKRKDSFSYPKLLISYKTGEYENKVDLYDINTGALVKRWLPDNKMLYEKAYNLDNPDKPPSESSDLYLRHPLMTADSSLVFVAPLTSMIARIDKNNKLVWMKNDKVYHHTLEMDDAGILYSCSRPFESAEYDFLPGNHDYYKDTFHDDHITMLDAKTGEELFYKSVVEILVENGYQDLLLFKGQTTSDPIHLNDIQPARYSSRYWEKGDLLVSSRHLSAIFLYRPSTNKILWLKHGPWYNQHDPDFYGDHQIVVFGNDVIRDESKAFERLSGKMDTFTKSRAHNEVYVYDFRNDSVSKPYHRLLSTENMRTDVEGRSEILPNGDVFLEETTKGRIMIGDSTTKKIEFSKRLDKEHIAYLFWGRIVR